MRTVFTGLLLLLLFSAQGQTIETKTLYAPLIKDSFVISIRKPLYYSNTKAYHHIYVADGSLKLGNYILGKDSNWMATVPENCIIITIAHTGDWHSKRRRDFIPSDAGGYSDKNFGQACNFYLLFKETLMPSINKQFPARQSSSFIGHSFSGLFCLYTLFQENKLFDHHFAISPSVWANDGELLKIEAAFFNRTKLLRANVDLQVGGLEFLNKVISSTKAFYNTTSQRKYTGYCVAYSTVNNANHYSIIKPAVDKILKKFLPASSF